MKKKPLLSRFERGLKAKYAGEKANAANKYTLLVKELDERFVIICKLEKIRLSLEMTKAQFARSLDNLGSPISLGNGKAQAYRNIISGYTGNKLSHIREVYRLAFKLQDCNRVKKK